MAVGEVRAFEDPDYARGAALKLPDLFPDADNGALRGIKRPDYLGRPEIPARLYAHIPEARLLAVLRDPIERAISSYFHFVRHGFLPIVPVDIAFTTLLEGGWEKQYPRSSEVLSYGRYGQHLKNYLEYFPHEQILLFEQRQLIDHLDACLERAFLFLGAEPFKQTSHRPRVSGRGVYSASRLSILRTKNRHRYVYAPDLSRREPRRMTPWGLAYNAAVVGLDRVVLSRFDDGRAPQLSTKTRAAVAEYYQEDAALLRELLPAWSVPAPWLESQND